MPDSQIMNAAVDFEVDLEQEILRLKALKAELAEAVNITRESLFKWRCEQRIYENKIAEVIAVIESAPAEAKAGE